MHEKLPVKSTQREAPCPVLPRTLEMGGPGTMDHPTMPETPTLESKSTRQMRSARKMLRRAFREEGATLIETAFTLIVLCMLLVGTMEFGRFMYVYHFTSEVAREATRYAIVRGSTWGTTTCTTITTMACNATAANVTAYVQSLTPATITASSWTTSTTCPPAATNNPVVCTYWPGTAPTGAAAGCSTTNGNNSPGCQVEVGISLPFQFYLPFMPSPTYTLQSTSWMVISQ
jgi:Flp pilus assembly protein TadG